MIAQMRSEVVHACVVSDGETGERNTVNNFIDANIHNFDNPMNLSSNQQIPLKLREWLILEMLILPSC